MQQPWDKQAFQRPQPQSLQKTQTQCPARSFPQARRRQQDEQLCHEAQLCREALHLRKFQQESHCQKKSCQKPQSRAWWAHT